MYKPTINSYFSGAGLMDYGIQEAGLQIDSSLELCNKACDTLRHNFDHDVQEVDVSNITVSEQSFSDVIIGTYPCTKYSTIADIHGTRTGDELFLHFFRHIALMQPEMFVVENVPGMMKFPVVMEAMTQLPDYYVKTFCPIEATTMGLPQMRKRLIIIGTRKRNFIEAPEKVEMKKLKDILEKDPEYTFTKGMENRINGVYRDLPKVLDPNDSNAVALTCVAHYAKDKSTSMVKCKPSEKNWGYGLRPLTVREYARLQGLPDSFEFPVSNTDAYKQIGNGVPVPIGRWVGEQILKHFN